MKQKFTLNIADIQLSVVTEASAAEVERIRGLLDRKMREIYLKSRCPKTEAALLCAMEFAADRMTLQEQVSELDERCEKYSVVLDGLKERNADQAAELDRLRSENAVLRSLLTTGEDAPAAAPDPISPAAFFAEVADAQTKAAEPAEEEMPEEAPDEDQIAIFEAPAEEAPVEAEPVAEAPRSRSRVGSMFEQLSFGDVD
ncbi:MAG: cell division protein ZapA [Clostridia bacterium]|nr:cell division protein ZapA [Clostridia bacterium]